MKKNFALLLLGVTVFLVSCEKNEVQLKKELTDTPTKGLIQSHQTNQQLDF